MMRALQLPLLAFAAFLVAAPALAGGASYAVAEVDDEVEVYSGQITALSCAIEALETDKLVYVTSCPMSEMAKGLVVYDVTEHQIFEISKKAVHRYELEKAAGGGSIDFEGTVVKVKGQVAVVDVEDYSITERPKAGAFKGCL